MWGVPAMSLLLVILTSSLAAGDRSGDIDRVLKDILKDYSKDTRPTGSEGGDYQVIFREGPKAFLHHQPLFFVRPSHT